MKARMYGTRGPQVVVVHGGPGAPGSMAPVARELAGSCRVIEPWQRGSGGDPLTVARHVADLHELVGSRCAGSEPVLVGHSWGAMLVLAYAAEYPEEIGPLVLIGCGTFDPVSRSRLQRDLDRRLTPSLRRRLATLPQEIPDADERLRVAGELLQTPYSHALVDSVPAIGACDARAYRETWDDMLRLQQEQVYPGSFAAIKAPILMLHGAADPHPGAMIRASLKPFVPQLEYREWQHCGHYPWLETEVLDEFFAVLREWIFRHAGREPCPSASVDAQ